MKYLDENPAVVQTGTIILTMLAASLVVVNFVRFVSTPNDENLFRDLFSHYYVTKPFEVVYYDALKSTGKAVAVKDTIEKADFITAFEGVALYSDPPANSDYKRVDLQKIIDKAPDDKVFKFHAARYNKPIKKEYFVKKSDLPENFFRYLETGVLVIYVFPDGASQKAGMKEKDIIVKINGQSFKDKFEANKLLVKGKTGKKLSYTVLRQNEEIELDVYLTRYGIRIDYLSMFLIGLAYIIFGGFIGAMRPRFPTARLMFAAFVLFGFMFSSHFNRYLFADDLFGETMYLLFLTAGCFAYPTVIFFSLKFPVERDYILKYKIIWLLPFIVFGCAYIAGMINYIYKLNNNLVFFTFSYVINLFSEVSLGYMLLINLIFIKKLSKEELKTGVMIASAIILTIGGFLYLTLRPKTGDMESETNVLLVAIPVLLILAAVYWTIIKYGIFNIRARFGKNVQYGIMYFAVTILALLGMFASIFFVAQVQIDFPSVSYDEAEIIVIQKPIDSQTQATVNGVVKSLLTLAAGAAFYYLHLLARRFINKLYFRTRSDYKKAATEFSRIVAKYVGLKDLSEKIAAELADLMKLKRSGVIFFRNGGDVCEQSYYQFTDVRLADFMKAKSVEFAKSISEADSAMNVEFLSEPLKSALREFDFRCVVPVRSKEKLTGVILVGEKLSETALSREDLNLLDAVAGQSSVAVENAFLYENLAQQERMRHELEIARRIQLASLPSRAPQIAGLDVSGSSSPAFEVGGDFFDYLHVNGSSLTVIVGDVSGKGAYSAMYMSKAQGILRALSEFDLPPKELFIRANKMLYELMEKTFFITAVGARIDLNDKSVLAARSGHLPLYHYNARLSKALKIAPKGVALGLSDSKLYEENLEEKKFYVERGDILLMITDGITEAKSPEKEEFGEKRLLELLVSNAKHSAEVIRDVILQNVSAFTELETQSDDVSIVVVKV